MAAPKVKPLILHATGLEPAELLGQLIEESHQHVCQTDGHEYAKEVRVSESILKDPGGFLGDPLLTILGTFDFCVKWNFTSSNEKTRVLESLEAELRGRSFTDSLVRDVALVADELFTNAVFNAPVAGRAHLKPVSRKQKSVAMKKGQFGQISIAADSSRLVLCCSDPYGSLDPQSYLTRIQLGFENGAGASIVDQGGGAGIGAFLVFNLCCSLFIGVWPGRATKICCVFPLKKSGRQRAMLKKHIHCIQL